MTQEHEDRIQSYVYKLPLAIQEAVKVDITFGYSLAESHYLPLLEAERAKVAKLVEGLQKIALPIKWMQNNLKEGEVLNGAYAIQLSENANWLKEQAAQLIAEYKTT